MRKGLKIKTKLKISVIIISKHLNASKRSNINLTKVTDCLFWSTNELEIYV